MKIFCGFVSLEEVTHRKLFASLLLSFFTVEVLSSCWISKRFINPLLCLFRVMERSGSNRMTTQNIGIVFGPTLMRPENESGNMAINMLYQNQAIELLLSQYQQIFGAELKQSQDESGDRAASLLHKPTVDMRGLYE